MDSDRWSVDGARAAPAAWWLGLDRGWRASLIGLAVVAAVAAS